MEACDSALAIAQPTGDLALEMGTLAYSSAVDYWHLRWQGKVTKGLRVIELARRAEDQLSEVLARFWVGVAVLGRGCAIGNRRVPSSVAPCCSHAIRCGKSA